MLKIIMAVAQLVKRFLPIPKIRGLNLVPKRQNSYLTRSNAWIIEDFKYEDEASSENKDKDIEDKSSDDETI